MISETATILDVPGDKSISHRCLILASQSQAESRFSNLNRGDDVARTAAALVRCGISCEPDKDEVVLAGAPLRSPAGELDFGNSGTSVRLMAGLLAGSRVSARLTGDDSLRGRPMDRIVLPLRAMGADVAAEGQGCLLPLVVRPASLRPLDYELPVASAQVKSCLMLAGLAAGVPVRIRERTATRDHTERLLAAMGAAIRRERDDVVLEPSAPLKPLSMRVPGDFSGAAFFLGLALLVPGARVTMPLIGVNPGRTGLLDVLLEMGADVRIERRASVAGEPVADLHAAYSGRLRGGEVPPELAPRLIDEVPLLAILAARAHGMTRITGVGELRVKESDRLRVLAAGLRAVGVRARELDEGIEIQGTSDPLEGFVETRLDHRIAMAFAVLGRAPGARIELSESASLATSFPEFPGLLNGLFS
jgi:3-phosphoshikimate 1-carboxyvinyltransferase